MMIEVNWNYFKSYLEDDIIVPAIDWLAKFLDMIFLLLLNYFPQTVSGPELVIQPCPFCDDFSAKLVSIPNID